MRQVPLRGQEELTEDLWHRSRPPAREPGRYQWGAWGRVKVERPGAHGKASDVTPGGWRLLGPRGT